MIELGLKSLLDRPPFRLSGGEKQWAAVASVLVFELAVFFLDELFGTVDAGYRKRIPELVIGHGGTVVLSTPSVDIVSKIADRVLVIGQDGSMAADGPVQDVLTDTTLLGDNGLQSPATAQLFEGTFGVDDAPLIVSEA